MIFSSLILILLLLVPSHAFAQSVGIIGTDTPVNYPPIADPQEVITVTGFSLTITLAGDDANDDVLTFDLVDAPLHGTLSGFDPATGVVTYTPAAGFSGSDDFTFQVNDGIANSDPATVTISVNPVLSFSPFSLPAGEIGVGYNVSLGISGGLPPYTTSVISGSLPPGLTLGSPKIIGTPQLAGSKSFTIKVTDQLGSSVTGKFKIKILKALGITTTALKAGTGGKNYKVTLKVTGGQKPYNWSLVSGNLPTGLTLDSSTGAITGIPTQIGVFNLTVQVTDPLGGQDQQDLPLTIN